MNVVMLGPAPDEELDTLTVAMVPNGRLKPAELI